VEMGRRPAAGPSGQPASAADAMATWRLTASLAGQGHEAHGPEAEHWLLRHLYPVTMTCAQYR
jgi:hypothetical protein